MTLSPGSRLGPYEVLAPLGAGGMGEVYRAKDTRLGREVAIKVLPAEVAGDPERLRRFEQEARAVSALNHPNIVTLFEVGESDSGPFLVLEKVEGRSLRELLRDGALPAKRVLALAAQIADGLAKAHAAGIVHRDLKPENVMVTDDGNAKILDFGLARLVYPEAAGLSPREMTTIAGATVSGMIVGTLGYLSPEQAQGRPADFRADQFGLGALVYEMATGERPFHRETALESLTAVIRDEPEPLRSKNASLPMPLAWIVERCLAKDPGDRYASTRDLARDLADLRDRLSEARYPSAVASEAPAPRRARSWIAVALLVAGAVTGAGATWLAARRATLAPQRETRFTVLPPPPGGIDGYPALSPDGRRLAYVLLDAEGKSKIAVHDFASGEAHAVEGTDDAIEPFWSPDGADLAFFSHSELRRVPATGGTPLTLCPALDPHGGSWGPGGTILFNAGSLWTISRVGALGGSPERLFELDEARGEQTARYPWVLPDGRHFLYTELGRSETSGIYWSDLASTARRRLLPDLSRAVFDPRGFLLFARNGALFAQRFDPRRGTLAGEPTLVAEHVGQNPQKIGDSFFSVGAGGVLAFRGSSGRPNQLVWFDRSGKRLGVVATRGQFMEPSLSPDGAQVLVGVLRLPEGDLSIFDAAATDRSSRVTFGAVAISPIWSPDGRHVLASTPTSAGMRMVLRSASGAGPEQTLLESATSVFADDWSRDGKLVLFERSGEGGSVDLWLLPTTGDRTPLPYVATPANESHASFSPDGRYVAYVSDESGSPEVYVQTLPRSESRWQLSSGGADQPQWSADGKELYFLAADRRLMAVPLRSLEPFDAGAPHPLFRLPVGGIAATGPRSVYAFSPDHSRVLVNALVDSPEEAGIQVVLNWQPVPRSR